MTTVSKTLPFKSIPPYASYSLPITFADGNKFTVSFRFGFIDIDMASNGLTSGCEVSWKDSSSERVGFNGCFSLNNVTSVIDPITGLTQFGIFPVRVDSVDVDSASQIVELILLENSNG